MRIGYIVVFYFALPFIFLRLLWRSRKEPEYRQRWRERLGFIAPIPAGCIWVHAVSLGETRAAIPLIRALQERYPSRSLLVTTMTPTGSRQVRESFADRIYHVYLPYDLPAAMQRFLQSTQPSIAIIMETELWPNLIHACHADNIPVVIVNARLSARSWRGYQRIKKLIQPALQKITLLAAQSKADAQRFIRLGMTTAQIRVCGNIKYDLNLPQGLAEQGATMRQQLFQERPVWIAASTHAGEEEIILAVHQQLCLSWSDLLLILVPRHPHRFDEVYTLCQHYQFTVQRRSQTQQCEPGIQVYLGDSMGELLQLYTLSDMAFVGGSLVPNGGHNILEPALLGIVPLFGSHMFNFSEAAQHLLDHQAAYQVADSDELFKQLDLLLSSKPLCETMGEKARIAATANRGALAKLFFLLEQIIMQNPIESAPQDKPSPAGKHSA